jgi:ceramide glucosyltransferase
MIHHTVQVMQAVAVLGALSAVGYYGLVLWSAAGFLRARKEAGRSARPTRFTPPVSILKPLKGTDPEMYESFRSHCLLDYPEYEIIFGVSEASDPAVELVERLKLEFPERVIQFMVCDPSLGTNTKVSNLAQMLTHAQYEYLIVNDSDIRVESNYLGRVMAPLEVPQTGLVTCLYRGVAARTVGSWLESLGISTDFSGGVLAARALEKQIRFGLGSTLAFRRRELEAIGGFEAVVDYLADDYEIGRRIAALGLRVELSEVVVETFLPPYTPAEYLSHQLRWARSIRDARPGGYAGMVFTFGLVWALLAVMLLRGAHWAWGLLTLVAVVRIAVAWVVGRSVLHDRQVLRLLFLVPVRDLIAVGVWIASFMGHTIHWRGDSFVLKHGKLARQA